MIKIKKQVLSDFEAKSVDRIVREVERRLITGRSRVSWWRDEREGRAPRRVKIGPNAVGWRLSDLIAWVQSRERVPEKVRKPGSPNGLR